MRKEEVSSSNREIIINGAREHNLRDLHLRIPRNKLVVFTGLSGSGKSSLAFDTIYAEGQRRYMESFSSYARYFIGKMERPDVDSISGLCPVISIEQKSVNKNPRSTVGTITEIYDFLRLLYAKASDAYSYNTGELMVRYSDDKIIDEIFRIYKGKTIWIMAPVVKARKGHYKELFEQIIKKGFIRVRVDGEIRVLVGALQLDRYKIHDIEVITDRITIEEENSRRISASLNEAMKLGKGIIMLQEQEGSELRYFSRRLMCPTTGIAYPDPEPNLFSFNSPYGACKKCNGLGTVSEMDMKKIIPNSKISIGSGGIEPLGRNNNSRTFRQVNGILEKYGFDLKTPIDEISSEAINAILYGSDEIFSLKDDKTGLNKFRNFSFEGIITILLRQNQDNPSKSFQKWVHGFMNKISCPGCGGSRLKAEAMHFKLDGKNIAEVSTMDMNLLSKWLKGIENRLKSTQAVIAREPIIEIRKRIGFMLDVGLGYLTLDRSARSLSGGESQRIRLATQIGSRLRGVLYILDEPSIGLHQSDNIRLINSLRQLRDAGNSVIVVEHDKEMINAADHVVDLGPGAGMKGGEIVAQGTPAEILSQQTLTTDYLSGRKRIAVPQKRREGNGKYLELKGASGHNLKNINVRFPLGKFICVTGVSGSGKSTLISETLFPLLNNKYHRSAHNILPCKSISGMEHLDKVIEITQSPIGRTPRSNPATYTGVFTEIRKLFARTSEAMIRGFKPGRFSFNVKGGRCETCFGAGLRLIEMNFLPDVYVHCDVCYGKRYNRETLNVRYKSKSISDILDMTVSRAVDFFENIPRIVRSIRMLEEVGLGYITLGQQATTLSGGEAQRLKLAVELARKDTGNTLYILDEPTTGLHFEDCRLLLKALERLLDRGNTVLVIEHNIDIIKMADHIIDLGPEGGEKGGRIIGEGTPEKLSRIEGNATAYFLSRELNPIPMHSKTAR